MNFFRWKKRILVVEDEPDIAEGIKARLEVAGYKAIVAVNGQAAVELARAKKPHLIVLDLMLPKIDGYDVCRILKREDRTKRIPILVLTALQMVGDINKAYEVGAADYLPKPFTNDKLLDKIEKLMS